MTPTLTDRTPKQFKFSVEKSRLIVRTKLLKLGALINVSTRRILIAITSSCPYKHIFAIAHRRLKILPNTA